MADRETATARLAARRSRVCCCGRLLMGLCLACRRPRRADPQDGFGKAAICASCHGPAGVSPVPTYPNLAGQNALYLEYALRRYRAGERRGDQSGMMYTVAQALSDDDIQDLAAYYAGLN